MLLASPFALGFAGSAAAWNAWVVGALILTLADTLSLAFDFSSWIHAQKLRYLARRISPKKRFRYGERDEHMPPNGSAGISLSVRTRSAERCSSEHL